MGENTVLIKRLSIMNISGNNGINTFRGNTPYRKNAQQVRRYDNNTLPKELDREIRREKRLQARKRQVIREKIALSLAALGLTGGIIGGIAGFNNEKEKNQQLTDNNAFSIQSEIEDSSQNKIILPDYSVETIFPDLSEEIQGDETYENSYEEAANEIFLMNNDVKIEYDKLKEAVDRFSQELGEPAIPLIKERIEKLGNGRVNIQDVLKILYIESRGRIYDTDNPDKILESKSGALGPFQITERTAEFVNEYYKLEGTEDELDVNNPYDNLDICILNLRFLKYQKGKELEEGKPLPTGSSLDLAVAWAYHDGAWADKITDNGKEYIKEYDTLSIIDDYPEVIAYISEENPDESIS